MKARTELLPMEERQLLHEDTMQVANLVATVGVQTLVEALRSDSTDKIKGKLRRRPPEGDGLLRYIWHMGRFAAGKTVGLPFHAERDLNEWLEQNGLAPLDYPRTDRESQLVHLLDVVVEQVLVSLGENPSKGAERWIRETLGL